MTLVRVDATMTFGELVLSHVRQLLFRYSSMRDVWLTVDGAVDGTVVVGYELITGERNFFGIPYRLYEEDSLNEIEEIIVRRLGRFPRDDS